jgi:predicted SAM-dependent methyltransferase
VKPKVLNVGCSHPGIALPEVFAGWEQIRLDIDPAMQPDILGDAREMIKQDGEQVEAVYCSHNLEHYYPHEVAVVLRGMRHLLKPGGFCVIAVPDLVFAARAVVEQGPAAVLYESPAGPITALDMIYGYAAMVAAGNGAHYAHKTGFSRDSLAEALRAAGFGRVEMKPGDQFTLVAVGYRDEPSGG